MRLLAVPHAVSERDRRGLDNRLPRVAWIAFLRGSRGAGDVAVDVRVQRGEKLVRFRVRVKRENLG